VRAPCITGHFDSLMVYSLVWLMKGYYGRIVAGGSKHV
jgi:hypothetical protein